MSTIFPPKPEGKITKSPHFWAILIISLFLIFIYHAWPWSAWNTKPWVYWLTPLYNLALVELMNRFIGILFLIPIIYAVVFFSWWGALGAFLLALIGVLPIAIVMWSTSSLITNIVLLLLPVMIVSIGTFEITWRQKERRHFVEREAERQLYVSKILESQENERLRLARELHDDTIQTLLVIANQAQNIIPADHDDIDNVRKKAVWIRDATLQAVEDIRRATLDLRPSILDNLGLVPALRWLVDRTSKESDIKVRIRVKGRSRDLPPKAEVNIFRITQEALNNIKRHSQATEVYIILKFEPEYLKICIEDNGQGFLPPEKFDTLAANGKLGLIGMKQRIDFLDGTFQIHSKPGEGTSLLIEAKC